MLYKKLKNILDLVLLVVLLLVVFSAMPFNFPIKSYIVASGSMNPIIKSGSLIFSQSFTKNNLKVGNIITFVSPKNNNVTIIHRINQIENDYIYTKGDNNNSVDDWKINKNEVLGKPFLLVPYVGNFYNLVHQPLGFILIICLPAFIFILIQTLSVKDALQKIENKKIIKILIIFFIPFFIILPQKIFAVFIDSVKISGISFIVGDFAQQTMSSEINSIKMENEKIKIQYTPSTLDFSDLKICNSFNLGSWNCFASDKSAIFSPPKGDGIYQFNTLIGKNGLFEDKDYSNNFLSFEVDQTPPTSNLNLSKSLNGIPYYLGEPLYVYPDFSLSKSNLVKQISFKLPQNLNAYIYFDYEGQSQDTCDYSSFKVIVNNQDILHTGPEEFSPNSWSNNSGLQNFFYQLSVGSADNDVYIDFSLPDSVSSDTVFNISNFKIYPISLRAANNFVAVADYHDTGSGVGSTSLTQSNDEISFSSVDILDNQEASHSIKYKIIPDVVINSISLDNVTLYKNKNDADLTGYYFSNFTGEIYPVTGMTNNFSFNFTSNWLSIDKFPWITLYNSSHQIVDKFDFSFAKENSSAWKRIPDGIGTWEITNLITDKIHAYFETDTNSKKIIMTISGFSNNFGLDPNDYLDYQINYQADEPKQIYEKIDSNSVSNQKIDRELYLENISIGQTIEIIITGQSGGKSIGNNVWQVSF